MKYKDRESYDLIINYFLIKNLLSTSYLKIWDKTII